MARELAAVYSQLFDLAFDVQLSMFCDPRHINKQTVLKNKEKVSVLFSNLYPLLSIQNKKETSSLSLELEHMLYNIHNGISKLYSSLCKNHTPVSFFKELHLSGPCEDHIEIDINFYGGFCKRVSLSLINDIEILFKRLNSVFYCISSKEAIACLTDTILFLGRLRNLSPIPNPDTYLTSIPCINCFQESSMLPNQGDCVLSILRRDVNCTHVCRQVKPDPIIGLFENELKQMGVSCDFLTAKNEKKEELTEYDSVKETSLNTLKNHTIFESLSTSILEISNLLYWSSGQTNKAEITEKTSHMTKLLSHESQMHSMRKFLTNGLNKGTETEHFFDSFSPSPLESLFCGGIFNSIEDTISALQKDCSLTFLKKSNYQNLIKKQNELFVRLNNILQQRKPDKKDDSCSIEGSVLGNGIKDNTPQQVISDAQVRKDCYIQKITRDGLKKLHDCIEAQSKILNNTLSLRVWGSTVYDEASKLMNHFLLRSQFVSAGCTNHSSNSKEWFDNSKYIKNALHSQKLSNEHIDTIIIKFYKLVTGPLSCNKTFFPVPDNVSLSYCFDAAGVMPHQKLILTEMIWPSIQSKDWIDSNFNQFYTIKSSDLNSIQKEAWQYIREAVLSISLYNRTWEKCLDLFSVTELYENCPNRDVETYPTGVYLTYEDSAPLMLIFEGKGFIFKDLYALLYYHLQLSGQEHIS
ncbi:DNA packaging terminase subunit 2 [Vespertilionid gammaherpesvirus 1]|uniref:DNA packaging terminase subunit 2 n=1 Tax=Vespertilionid gammaherpesvirus 1 TaxID=2560830 RepID=A0A0X9XSJ1_9GAMA|nr:DNA packaging terminase subunit 2 [Myotis gammaherpesvirus 8]AMA67367.1 DNA packaging terminase subunit 2 [Vespertilionid gammaherpesvirus 1]